MLVSFVVYHLALRPTVLIKSEHHVRGLGVVQ